MMTVKILPNEHGNPPGKLADVELLFVDVLCPTCLGDRVLTVAQTGPLAGAEGPCTTCDGHGVLVGSNPLTGLKLIGFAIWERRGGSGRNVTFPARQYSVNGERRSFALLRPITDAKAQDTIRDRILEAYATFEHLRDHAEPVGPVSDFAQGLAEAIRTATPVAEAPFSLTATSADAGTVQGSLLK